MAKVKTVRRIVDLSHRVTSGMRGYPGIPAPSITAFLTHEASRARYDGQCELTFSHVDIVAGTGTYLDSPYHRDSALPDFATLPLSAAADLPGVVLDVRARPGRAIRPEELGVGAWAGCAVLLRTGMEECWETDQYWDNSPFLLAETARALLERGAALVGVDFLNVDDVTNPRRPAHTLLLRAGVPIVENLCRVAALPPRGFRLHAAPPPLVGVASFPIRAYAVVEEASG
ncbi:MAG TPA: cyclase family protein [bacterium]|nr:cyclase family protein [bacterium]